MVARRGQRRRAADLSTPDATFWFFGGLSWFYGGASARARPAILRVASGPRAGVGRRVYSADVIREIQRRLGEPGATQRSVARDMGLSRGTVHNVASGKRKAVDRESPGAELEIRVGRLRCGGCGGLIVVAPCRACKARATPRKPSPDPAEDPGPVKIELVDGDRERYESIPSLPRKMKARLRRQAEEEQAAREETEAKF